METWVKFVGVGLALILVAFDLMSLVIARKEREERKKFFESTDRLLQQSLADEEARKNHLDALQAVARLYSRAEYEQLISERIQSATQDLNCYWYSLNPTAKDPKYGAMNKMLGDAQTRKVMVRIITARDRRRLSAAYELRQVGVDVRFNRTVAALDLRFTLTDGERVVLGGTGQRVLASSPSREGVEVRGSKLSLLLEQYFEGQWAEAAGYDVYAAETVRHILADVTNSKKLVAEELGITIGEVERLAALSV